MKKIINKLLIGIFLLSLFASCEIDNFDTPSAKFFGAIKDSIGGALVETDLINGSTIQAYEKGYPTEVAQTWVIKNNGEFVNNLVFPGTYDLVLRNGNFFPYTVEGVEIQPGENQRDFLVVPYIRIKNSSITYDKAGNKVVATFSLEAGKPSVKVKAVRLYAFTDIYVGEQVKYNTTGGNFAQTFNPSKTIDGTSYTLSIDLNANSSYFKQGQNYYFRIGALADVSGVGTIRHNYSQIVKITL